MSLYCCAINRPWLVCAIACLVMLATAPGLAFLRLRTDGNALLPPEAPEVLADHAIRDAFGVRDPIVVVVRSHHENGIFNPRTLQLVLDLTHAIGALAHVDPEDVVSLATERSHRVKTGTLTHRHHLDPVPQALHELSSLRQELERLRVYSGTLISYDHASTCILVGVAAGADRPALLREIHRLIQAAEAGPDEISVVGGPVAESLMGAHILADLGVPAIWQGIPFSLRHSESPKTVGQWITHGIRAIGLLPMVIAVMFLLLYATFRSLAAAILPLAEVGACLVFVFAAMGWLGVPVYLTIAVLPAILTAVGIADEIHIFSCYRRLLAQNPEVRHVVLVKRAMDEMWRPVIKTSVTTAIGFASFCLAPLVPVQAFGIFTAVGVLFCMFWSLTVIPACLVIIPPGIFVGAKRNVVNARQGGWLARATLAVTRRPGLCITAVLLVIAAAPFAIRRVTVQDSWIDGFAEDSEFYEAMQFTNASFAGSHILLIEVRGDSSDVRARVAPAQMGLRRIELAADLLKNPERLRGQWIKITPALPRIATPSTGDDRLDRLPPTRIRDVVLRGERIELATDIYYGGFLAGRENDVASYQVRITPRPLLDPHTLQRICGLERFVASRQHLEVGGVLGLCDRIVTTNFMLHGLKEERRSLPETAEAALKLWQSYELVWGARRRAWVLDDDHSRCLITVFMRNANYRDVKELLHQIRGYEHDHLADHGLALVFGGDVACSQAMIGSIVSAQTRSLLASILGILVVTVLLSRSLFWGVLCVLPCGLALLMNFAFMGAFGLPLGVATSMFASMSLGLGVDYAIHLTERYRALRRAEKGGVAAIVEAVATAGPAIMTDALAVALGFAVLIASAVPANAKLGALVVLSVLSCLLWTLVLLPALLSMGLSRRGPGLAQVHTGP